MIVIRQSSVLRGPSIWDRSPVIHLDLAVDGLDAADGPVLPSPGVVERLMAILPSLTEGLPDEGRDSVAREAPSLIDLVVPVALAVQRLAGAAVRQGRVLPADSPDRWDVVYAYESDRAGIAAGEFAIRLLNHLQVESEPALDAATFLRETVTRLVRLRPFGPSTEAIIRAAQEQGIPVLRLDPDRSLVQLGHGRHQRRIWTTISSTTSDLGAKIALDKGLTNQLLRLSGLPAPRGATVGSADEAVRQAAAIGYPVVLKPIDGNHGRGVCADLRDADAVRRGYPVAVAASRDGQVLLEACVAGRDYRVLVVNGSVVAVAERQPAAVTGDGQRTVAQLIDRENADPRRGIGHETPLTRITVDDATIDLLDEQGLTRSSVPANGRIVRLKRTANISTGGTAIDRTDVIHPDNVVIAQDAALTIGLDIAGIDLVTPDISRSVRAVGGGIVEVNAGPGLRMHTHPSEGAPRPVGRAIIGLLFPEGRPSRIPIVAVTGTNGKTTTTRMIAQIMRAAGRTVGLTTTDGIEIDGTLIATGDMAGPASARLVLHHPRIDCAVLETARGGILRSGLGFDRCDVAVVTNVASDHLGLGGIDTLDDLAKVKAVLPGAVSQDGVAVLNADDPRTAAMARITPGSTMFFSMESDNPVVLDHLRDLGRAVVLVEEGGEEIIALFDRHGRTPVMPVRDIPATADGRIRVNIANAMAATAAAVALDVPLTVVHDALGRFGHGFDQTPGRFNLLSIEGRDVLVDYGHNVAALRAVGEFVRRSSYRASVAVLTSPGDRRDADITAFGELGACIFDRLVIRDGSTLRNRAPGEVSTLLREAALAAGMPAASITMAGEDLAAAHAAIDLAAPGDLVMVMTERIAPTWASLTERLTRGGGIQGNGPTESPSPA